MAPRLVRQRGCHRPCVFNPTPEAVATATSGCAAGRRPCRSWRSGPCGTAQWALQWIVHPVKGLPRCVGLGFRRGSGRWCLPLVLLGQQGQVAERRLPPTQPKTQTLCLQYMKFAPPKSMGGIFNYLRPVHECFHTKKRLNAAGCVAQPQGWSQDRSACDL